MLKGCVLEELEDVITQLQIVLRHITKEVAASRELQVGAEKEEYV